MKKILIILAILMMAYPVAATLSAPTSWSSGYKIFGKYWDCMGQPCMQNYSTNLMPQYNYTVSNISSTIYIYYSNGTLAASGGGLNASLGTFLQKNTISDASFAFLPGMYNGTINITTNGNSNITLISPGFKSAMLMADSSQTDPIINISCTNSGLCLGNHIEGFYIDGAGASISPVINISVGRQNEIIHNYITNVANIGIGVYGLSGSTNNPYETRIERNTLDNPLGYGVSANVQGIYFDPNAHDGYIVDNVVDHWNSVGDSGIRVDGSAHEIRGNHVWGVYEGINATGAINKVYGNILDSTMINGVASMGIGNQIYGNMFEANNQSQILTPTYAVNLTSTSASNIVFGNFVYNYATSKVQNFSNNLGSGNVIFGNAARGTGGASTMDIQSGLMSSGNISVGTSLKYGGGSCIQMNSPDGTSYRLQIANGGTTAITAGACAGTQP